MAKNQQQLVTRLLQQQQRPLTHTTKQLLPLQRAPFSGKTRAEEDEAVSKEKILSGKLALKPTREQRRLYADYMELTKFKLSLLNSIGSYTMFYFHAPLVGVGLLNSALFLFATQTIAMSTQCFGQIKEAEFDAQMTRTKNRPMAQERISSKQACFIGTGLTVSSLAAYHAFMPFTWCVASGVWLSYLAVYLPMKRTSEYNTLVGAIVGAMPPFIGSFAHTGTLFDPASMLLASYIFTWQFPHFYGILYEHKDDYKRAGFVMTSNDDPEGDAKATKQILACTVANTVIPCAMAAQGLIHPAFLVPFLATQVSAFQATYNFSKDKASPAAAKKLKRASYPPFMVLLIGFTATTAWNKFNKRREQDSQDWDTTPETSQFDRVVAMASTWWDNSPQSKQQ